MTESPGQDRETSSGDEPRSAVTPRIYLNRLPQSDFKREKFDHRGFNLHAKAEKPRNVVIFVHGFNGSGYTTWGDFPKFMFESQSFNCDIAVFRYDTGLVAALTRKVHLPIVVRRLVSAIHELVEDYKYESIYLVGHSLGGLVVQRAVRNYLTDAALSNGKVNDSIGAMLFFGSPRAGTWQGMRGLSWLFREFNWLSRFSEEVGETERFYTDHVESTLIARPINKRYLIPRLVCVGAADAVVNEFSVTFGIPQSLTCPLDVNHRQLSKPVSEDGPQVQWIIKSLLSVDELRLQWARERKHSDRRHDERPLKPAIIVTELWTGPSGTAWAKAYNDVRELMSDGQIEIKDKADMESAAIPVDLLVSLHDARRVVNHRESEQPIFMAAHELHSRIEELTVGISPVGSQAALAEDVMENWLPHPRPLRNFFIRGSLDENDLRERITDWLQLVANGTRPRVLGARQDQIAGFDGTIDDFGKR